jgi:predicted RNase H-like nuclease (RuvC/YqgF family)
VGPDNSFADVARLPPSLDLSLENLDEDLECCLHRVSSVLPSYFHVIVLALIDYSISQALSKKKRAKRAAKSVQVAKNAELEALVRSQAEKITGLEMAYADLKRENDNVTTGYQRLVAKHHAFTEKAEQEKMKLAEAHTTELAKLHGDLDLETCSYTKYCHTMCR